MKQAHAAFRSSLGETRAASGRGAYDQAREVLFAACRSREVALESDGHGHFTTRATRLLASGHSGNHQRGISAARGAGLWRELRAKPRAALRRRALRSRPLLAPIGSAAADAREMLRTPTLGPRRWRGEVARHPRERRASAPRLRPWPKSPSPSAATPQATAAVAQTRERPDAADGRLADRAALRGRGRDFKIDDGVTRPVQSLPYERQPGDPIYRPLRIFSLDPSASRLEGAEATVNVPYEPLEPGPVGPCL